MSRRPPVATLTLALVAVGLAVGATLASASPTAPSAPQSALDDPERSVPSARPGADGAPIWSDERPGGPDGGADSWDQPRAALPLEGDLGLEDLVVVPPVTDEPVDLGPEPPLSEPIVTAEGFHVVAGDATAGEGTTVRYTVEVEPAVRQDPLAVAAVVEEALHDPRSWAADVRLERVEEPGDADIRVVLATPDTVDELCARAGLNTAGRFSCWNGQFAALNAMRWEQGADGFDDLAVYRRYLVNHEFGHGLGYGHVDCPAPGELAPVMMQQTMGTNGCVANGWVYPERDAD
ncbi:MAG: DUF3152 domain-containing protein [Nitriliruptoraceae bacterium]|nr:DUF3152 domain-containing protein [Nitriliruptoraceae bacterium]